MFSVSICIVHIHGRVRGETLTQIATGGAKQFAAADHLGVADALGLHTSCSIRRDEDLLQLLPVERLHVRRVPAFCHLPVGPRGWERYGHQPTDKSPAIHFDGKITENFSHFHLSTPPSSFFLLSQVYFLVHHFAAKDFEGIKMYALMQGKDGVADGGVVGQPEVFL